MSGLEDFPDASGSPKAFLMPGTSRKYTFQGDCVSLARDKRDPRVEHCTAADVESRHGN